jgi:RNA polymerase sigma-70 factor (sigma-B/F/G subfamily)
VGGDKRRPPSADRPAGDAETQVNDLDDPVAEAVLAAPEISRAAPDQARARRLFELLATLAEGDPERLRIRSELIELHLPLVEYLARRYRSRGEWLDDLTQVATIGLIKSIDVFDPTRGVEFSTYAIPTIVGEIRRHVRDKGWAVRVPRRPQELKLALTKAIGDLAERDGRTPTVAEIAAHLHMSVEEVHEGLASAYVSAAPSAPDPIADDAPGGGGPPGLEEAAAGVEHPTSLGPLLARLPPNEKRILLLAFDGNMTESQIASELGLSQRSVSRTLMLARTLMQARTLTSLSANRIEEPDLAAVAEQSPPWSSQTVGGSDRSARSGELPSPSGASPPSPGGASPRPGPEPDRYLVGEMQSRVRAGAELSLIVSITTESPEPGLAAAPLPGLPPGHQGNRVTLIARPDSGLLALGDLQQTVTVPPRGDSQPVRFAFRARTVGLSRIRLTSWLGGTFLAELRLEVSVEPQEPRGDSQRRSATIGAMRADPGEVTLQVHSDGERYSFQLLSQQYLFGPVVAKSLTEKPGQAVERTVAMLRKMAGDMSGYTPALAARWVKETGTGLWQDLVPKAIQDQFWQLRDSITSFTIACADDAMPWELLYPLTRTEDAGFLVEQFPVLRRIYGQGRSHRVWIGEPRYVVPPGSPENARDEVDAISRILGQPAGAAIADLGGLLDLLDAGGTGLLHFACHNTFSLETGGSSIKMAGGAFVPQLLNSAVGRRCLAASSPLIFVNACRSAGVSAEYTQMMGWASQFMAAGAGAFLGTLWPVRSTRASMFAEAFYASLMAGEDLGRATLAARKAAKDNADPTWLAYTSYGDPAASAVQGS